MSTTSTVLGIDIPEPHVDTWNESMGMVTDAFETIDAFAGDVESSIATVEQTVATASHAVGDYFMLGGVLMRTTTAIATGERITTSNATPATMQSQIDTLRDSVFLSSTSDFFTPTNCTVGDEHDLYKYGKCVMVKLVITTTESISGLLYVGTIASAYAPRMQALVVTAQPNVFGFVNANGRMYVKDATGATHSSGYQVDIWVTYMTA